MYVPFLQFCPRFYSHRVLFIAKKKCSMATQEKGKHAASLADEVDQDDTAAEQRIRGKGMFCVSESRYLSKSTDYFLIS